MKSGFSIAVKIGGSFSLILILTCLISVVGISSLSKVITRAEKVNEMSGIVNNLLEARRHEKNLIIRKDRQYLEKVLSATATAKKQALDTKSYFKKEVNKKLMDEVVKGITDYEEAFNKYVSIYLQPSPDEKQLQELDKVMVKEARDAQESCEKALKGQQQQMIEDSTSAKRNSVLFFIISILLGAALATILTLRITRPLRQVVQASETIASGDLTSTVTCNGTDEIGQLSASINNMTANLSEIVTHITESSCSVASAAVQLHSNTEMITQGVKEVESQAISLGTASEEMASTSTDIARNCHLAAQSSSRASNEAETGVAVVSENIKDMQRIAERVKLSALAVSSLGARSEQIGQIVGTIEDIADQTNLLALNAAIEAARAGEQGRGFAVVADEVRALAERTTRATREISEMIKSIQAETGNAVNTMNQGVAEVESGMENSRKSEQVLQGILNHINEVTNQITQISTATEEQTATSHEVAKNIQQVINSMDTSMHSVSDSDLAINHLIKLAEELLQKVRSFKVSGHEMVIIDLAKNDHRLFVSKVRAALGMPNSLDPANLANHHTCRFGKWYDTDGKVTCGTLHSFKAIDTPHERIHSLAKDAVAAANSGNESKAKQLFGEVEQLSHVVVDNLAKIKNEFNEQNRKS